MTAVVVSKPTTGTLARAQEAQEAIKKATGEDAKERGRRILAKGDLRGQAHSIYNTLRNLKVPIDKPPAEGPALKGWIESASFILKTHTAKAPGRPGRKHEGALTTVLSDEVCRSVLKQDPNAIRKAGEKAERREAQKATGEAGKKKKGNKGKSKKAQQNAKRRAAKGK